MSAVLTALYKDHDAAERVRTRLVEDGFPTDRVELTSREELGRASMVPAASLEQKLRHYFEQLFQAEGDRDSVQRLEQAVLRSHAALAVHPRGETETQRALKLMEDGAPIEFRSSDLHNQAGENATGGSDTISWIGKIMVAPLAPNRTSRGAGRSAQPTRR